MFPLKFHNLGVGFRGVGLSRRSTGRHREIQPLGCENLGGTPNPYLSDRIVEVFCRNMPILRIKIPRL